jgi:hypothetical protein
VLAFRHPGVIHRYCKDHGGSLTEAEEVFQAMLEWLYLGAHCAADTESTGGCVMTEEIEKIDWMWHAFLLFTVDYAPLQASCAGGAAPSATTASDCGSPGGASTSLSRCGWRCRPVDKKALEPIVRHGASLRDLAL